MTNARPSDMTPGSRRLRSLLAAVAVTLVVTPGGCGGDSGDGPAATASAPASSGSPSAAEEVPEVVGVEVTREGDRTYRFDVTVSSPYDRPDKYADAWRILGPAGEVYGIRELTHPHAAEQPFTRSLSGVDIPDGVRDVRVEARDLVDGWSGQTFAVELP